MHKQWYIYHVDFATSEPTEGYFGPFEEGELTERLNDAYADLLAACGSLEEIELSDAEADKIYINPKEYWMNQVSAIEEDRKKNT